MDAAIRLQVLDLARSLGLTPDLKSDGADRLKKLIGLAPRGAAPNIYVHKDAGQTADPATRVFKVVVHPGHFIEAVALDIRGVTKLTNRMDGGDLHRHSGYRGLADNPAGGEPMGRAYAVTGLDAMRSLLARLASETECRPLSTAPRSANAPGAIPAGRNNAAHPLRHNSSPENTRQAATKSAPHPTRALVVDRPWVDLLLDGEKTWEMRSRHTRIRGRIALIEKGSGTLIGEIDLVDSVGPLSRDELAAGERQHQITESRLPASAWVHRWNHAWVMASPTRYSRPIPYEHPSGAVTWVNLSTQFDDDVASA